MMVQARSTTLLLTCGLFCVSKGFISPFVTDIAWGAQRTTTISAVKIFSAQKVNVRSEDQRHGYYRKEFRMSVYDMLGADVESGGLFDPLGFSRDETALFRRRAVELKHGRVAMVAMVGILVQSFFRFPGLPSFPVSNPARPLAVLEGLWHSDQNAMLLALLAVGLFELTIGRQDYIDRAPGELGEFGALAKPVDEDEWEKVQIAEIKHGRLAMLAVSGCFAQEIVTGEGPVEQLFTGNVNPFKELDFFPLS